MISQFMPALPFALLAGLALLISLEVASAVRGSRRPTVPEDGCCGCGAATADVVIRCGETYCWNCADTWPAGATPPAELGMRAFPGHERSAR
jgi:hypothetical protein